MNINGKVQITVNMLSVNHHNLYSDSVLSATLLADS